MVLLNLNRSAEYYTELHTTSAFSALSNRNITANRVCLNYVAFEIARKESIPYIYIYIYIYNILSYDTLEMDHSV